MSIPSTTQPSPPASRRVNRPRTDSRVLPPALAICALSMALALGLKFLGILERIDLAIGGMVQVPKDGGGMASAFPNHLPISVIWLSAGIFSLFVATAVLSVAGWERRLIIWFTSQLLVTTWAPVLSLAAFMPEISAPWVATAWAGFCAVVHAANHRMPCDSPKIPRS